MQNLSEVPITDLLRYSPNYFIKNVFNYRIGTVHNNILDHIINHKFTLDLAPRDHGKSRMLIGYVTWLAVNDPGVRILIVSDTDGHAQNAVRTIKTICEASPIIKRFYGDVRGERWTDHALIMKGRDVVYTEPTIMAVGAGSGAATGLHVDHIFVDDLVNFDNARSELQRKRQKDWLKITLMPVLMPTSRFHAFGTRYHYADTYYTFIHDLKFHLQIQRAISSDGTALCEWLHPIHDEIDPDTGEILRKGLTSIKEDLGPITFALQYQNDVELMKEGNIFKHKWFRYYDRIEWGEDQQLYVVRGDVRKRIVKTFVGIDPAISLKDIAAFTAIVVIGQDEDRNLYVIDFINEHLTFSQQKKRTIEVCERYYPMAVNLEDVAYQKALIQELRAAGGMHVNAMHPLHDKVARANAVTGFFEAGMVHFLPSQTDLVDQLLLFPDGLHNDLVDATVYALYGFKSGSSIMFVVGLDDDLDE